VFDLLILSTIHDNKVRVTKEDLAKGNIIIFKKILDAGKTYLKRFNGDVIIHLANVASASDRIYNINRRLKVATTESERCQLKEELRKAEVEYDHYQDLANKDTENIAQDNDRISRIMGSDTEQSMHLFRNKEETNCPFKNKGDRFELEVGRLFEKKGCFVFYNGMLRSEADQGVDLVIYDSGEKIVWYAQCKNWTAIALDCDELTAILEKMSRQRVIPTRGEIQHQKEAGWSNGNHFDDRINYELKYCLVVPQYESLTQQAQEKWLGGLVTIPQRAGNKILMETFLCNNDSLKPWIHFD